MTPQGQIAPGLLQLLNRMHELATEMTKPAGYNWGFNAGIAPAGAPGEDVSHLRLIYNAEEYECVCEVPEGAPLYDIWKRGQDINVGLDGCELLHSKLDVEQAAHFMLKAYHEAKLHRVAQRHAQQN